ncbi:MAG: hypothetical protein ACI8W8_000716 [Rhodothermales bacterium]|jgi:hypothetical protein
MSIIRYVLLIAIFAILPLASFAVHPDRERPPVELASASLLLGSTPRVPSNSWATWNFSVRNTSDSPVTVDLELNAIGGRASAVHESRLTVPAGFTLNSSAPVVLTASDRYETSLRVGGNKVDYTESMLRVLSDNKHLVWVINDDDELPLGQIARNDNLHQDFETVYCGAGKLPRHWAGYADIHTLVMLRPNYAEMSSHAVIAIQRWVARGGMLLFIDPVGILEASDGPLSQLLPIVPMRLRKLETLDALIAIGGSSITWPDGIDFLESVPLDLGISTLVQGDYPIARWHRHHLGTVGCTLVNPGSDVLRDSPDFDVFWRHLLSFGGGLKPASSNASPELARGLRLLTGVTIPSASSIRRVVIGYLLVVLIAVTAGYYCRRRLLIWAVLAVVALVTTIVIFQIANTRGARKANDLASVVRLEPAGAALAGSEQVTAIFSRSERTVDVQTTSIDQRIRSRIDRGFTGMTSAKGDKSKQRMKGKKGSSHGIRDVLQVVSVDSTMGLDDQLLRQAALLQYSCETNAPAQAHIPAPTIEWQADGPVLGPWNSPDYLANPIMAMLTCEGGVIPVEATGNRVAIGETGVLSPELQSLRDFFAQSSRQAPTLALVHDTDSGDAIPEGFAIHGKRVALLPVHQTIGGSVHLPGSRIRFTASSPGARRLRFYGQWQSLHQSNTTTEAVFDAWIPAPFTQLSPEQVSVTFTGDNRGQNIDFSIAVTSFDGDADSAIEPTRVEGNRYIFDQLPDGFSDPSDGLFRVIIRATPIKQLRAEQAMRANSWEVRKFAIAISGSLPDHIRGSF